MPRATAHTEVLKLKCADRHCEARATVKVRDQYGTDWGNYCRTHAAALVAKLKATEKESERK